MPSTRFVQAGGGSQQCSIRAGASLDGPPSTAVGVTSGPIRHEWRPQRSIFIELSMARCALSAVLPKSDLSLASRAM